MYLFLHTAHFQAVKITVDNLEDVPALISAVPSSKDNPFIRIEVLEKVDTGIGEKPFVWNVIERII
jgi:hypothetical protein